MIQQENSPFPSLQLIPTPSLWFNTILYALVGTISVPFSHHKIDYLEIKGGNVIIGKCQWKMA